MPRPCLASEGIAHPLARFPGAIFDQNSKMEKSERERELERNHREREKSERERIFFFFFFPIFWGSNFAGEITTPKNRRPQSKLVLASLPERKGASYVNTKNIQIGEHWRFFGVVISPAKLLPQKIADRSLNRHWLVSQRGRELAM